MSVLALQNGPEYLEILQRFGPILSDYQRGEMNKVLISLQELKAKPLSSQSLAVVEASESLLLRKPIIKPETFAQDVRTEQHYLQLFRKKTGSNEEEIRHLQAQVAVAQRSLKKLQEK